MKYMKPLTIGVWALVFFQIPIAVSKWNYNVCVDQVIERFNDYGPPKWTPLKAMAYNYCHGGSGAEPRA